MIIEGNNITMMQGDSETITLSCKGIDGLPMALITGDAVYFTVKRYITEDDFILQKIVDVFDDGKAIIELAPADTEELTGSYVYDIQLNRADGTIKTIVKPAEFTVKRGVTT